MCINADVALIRCGEAEELDFLDLQFCPHLWPRTVESDKEWDGGYKGRKWVQTPLSSETGWGTQTFGGVRVEPLLLNIKLSRSRWFMQLAMMPSGCLLSEVFQACTTQEIQMHEDTMKRLRVLRDFWTPQCPLRRSWRRWLEIGI